MSLKKLYIEKKDLIVTSKLLTYASYLLAFTVMVSLASSVASEKLWLVVGCKLYTKDVLINLLAS